MMMITIYDITDACCVLAQGDYTDRHSQAANIVHLELTIIYGLSKRPTPY